MKWRSIVFYGLLVAMSFYSMQSCQCNREDVKPDPCKNAQPTSADFTISKEILGGQTCADQPLYQRQLIINLEDGDTTIQNGQAFYFSAHQDFDDYTWTIGDDPREFKEKSFGLNIYLEGATHLSLDIRLVGKRAPNPCIAGDDGIDTVTKHITILDDDQHILYGSYFGYNLDAPNDTFTVTIDTFRIFTNPKHLYFGIYNFPKGQKTELRLTNDIHKDYRYFLLDAWKSGLYDEQAVGIGEVSNNRQTLKIEYYPECASGGKRIFVGQRIN